MSTIFNHLQTIKSQILALKQDVSEAPDVKLLAVSKAQSPAAIREAFTLGVSLFGENYLQEALAKQVELADLAIEWHFIGPIQSNKTQLIAQHFVWVQSVDRLKIAQRLNDARPAEMPPLHVCLQVNISGEESKSGVNADELIELATAIKQLSRLQLRGLMAIPAPTKNVVKQREQFKEVRNCYDNLVNQGFKLDTLSMGMSDDYAVAIEEGATMIRIGSALFGARLYPSKQQQT